MLYLPSDAVGANDSDGAEQEAVSRGAINPSMGVCVCFLRVRMEVWKFMNEDFSVTVLICIVSVVETVKSYLYSVHIPIIFL